MKSRDFCYWLQGYFEIADSYALSVKQVEVIRNHLNMVFIHEIDPSYPIEQQEALDDAHAGKVDIETKPSWPRPHGDISGYMMRC